MQNHSEQRTDLKTMGRPVSPADLISSAPALRATLPLSLCHGRRDDSSDASPIFSRSLSKSTVPRCYTNSAVDPVSATEANLNQAFASMSVS